MPKVIYIAGFPRSGSTILHQALASIDGFVGVGEVRAIWDYGLTRNRPCGCGEPFRSCAFWNQVVSDVFGSVEAAPGESMSRLFRQFRLRNIHQLLVPAWRRRFLDRFAQQGRFIRQLYDAILRRSGCRVVVDSSKDPFYGMFINCLAGLEIYPLHMVRDSRACKYSHYKTKRRVRIANWNLRTAFSDRLARQAGQRGQIVRYEDFCAAPQEAMELILRRCDENVANPISDRRTVRLGTIHSVAGNPIRYQQGEHPIELQEEWREHLPTLSQCTVTLQTLPGLVRYRYLRKAKPGPVN